MFEYWFLNLNDGHGAFSHNGTTHDFLEVVSQVTQILGAEATGNWLTELLTKLEAKVAFLRVDTWEFEYAVPDSPVIVRLEKKR